MCILTLADDMTGALEVGAKFSGAGIRTLVSARPESADSGHVVFDTETRHVSPDVAAVEVKRFVRHWGASPPRVIYKKTDSTLRGNIAAELQALAELYPDWRIGYAPAYPALGRTVKRGVLYVDGVPVERTAFAHDALNPVRSSSIRKMLPRNLPCTIFDGETDADLREAARAILADPSMRIAAGPAGLAETIAEQIDVPRAAPPPMPAVRTCLVMNGSLHERSSVQMRHAEAHGWKVVRADHHRENASLLVNHMAADRPDAIFVIGGDTAYAVIAELGFPPLSPIGEVVPGVPVTRIESLGVLLITKAGGFGDPDVFRQVRQKLETDAR